MCVLGTELQSSVLAAVTLPAELSHGPHSLPNIELHTVGTVIAFALTVFCQVKITLFLFMCVCLVCGCKSHRVMWPSEDNLKEWVLLFNHRVDPSYSAQVVRLGGKHFDLLSHLQPWPFCLVVSAVCIMGYAWSKELN